ncbi:MAG: GGDEF domain-containing protein [Bacteriovoracaceae bacterium]|nr:GGDEF domain-containing protein [Bacteriovoracaceae bacterium]
MKSYYSVLIIGFSEEKSKLLEQYASTSHSPIKINLATAAKIEKIAENEFRTADFVFISHEILSEKNLSKIKAIKEQNSHLVIAALVEKHDDGFTQSTKQNGINQVALFEEEAISVLFKELILNTEHVQASYLRNLVDVISKDIKNIDEYLTVIYQYLNIYIDIKYYHVLKVSLRRGEGIIQIHASTKKIGKKQKIIIENQNYEFLKVREHNSMNVFFDEIEDDQALATFNLGYYEKYPIYVQVIIANSEKNILLDILNHHFFKVSLRTLALIEAIEFKEIFSELAHKDDVTGLYNQRRLYNDLDRLVKSFESNQKNFCVLFIDIDNFKLVNDGHGHIVGTELLNSLSHIFRDYIRETDLIYRYGGDEFVIILPETPAESATVVCERLLKVIKSRNFKVSNGNVYHLSVSIGIAEFPVDAKTSKDIISIADNMMYNSKRMGRGRVISTKDILTK